MTDNQIAEEYICNGKCQDDITRNYVHCKSCTRIEDFLTGLKVGRLTKWHDRMDERERPSSLCHNPRSICIRCDRRSSCEYSDTGAYIGECKDFIYKEV